MSASVQVAQAEMAQLVLTLYVAGDNAFSRRAQANLQSILAEVGLQVTVNVVDVIKHPELTMEKRIFVTPALVVSGEEGQESLIVGDFRERDKIIRVLQSSGGAAYRNLPRATESAL